MWRSCSVVAHTKQFHTGKLTCVWNKTRQAEIIQINNSWSYASKQNYNIRAFLFKCRTLGVEKKGWFQRVAWRNRSHITQQKILQCKPCYTCQVRTIVLATPTQTNMLIQGKQQINNPVGTWPLAMHKSRAKTSTSGTHMLKDCSRFNTQNLHTHAHKKAHGYNVEFLPSHELTCNGDTLWLSDQDSSAYVEWKPKLNARSTLINPSASFTQPTDIAQLKHNLSPRNWLWEQVFSTNLPSKDVPFLEGLLEYWGWNEQINY